MPAAGALMRAERRRVRRATPQVLGDALARRARPTVRGRGRACRRSRRISSTQASDARAIAADERVRALLDRDRSLGVVAHRQAGHRRAPSFLPGCRRSRSAPGAPAPAGPAFRDSPAARSSAIRRAGEQRRKPEALDVRPGPRVHRPDQRQRAARRRAVWRAPRASASGLVDIGRAMQRDDTEPAGPRDIAASRSRRARSVSAGATARARCCSSESIITLPTKRMRAASMPSRARLSAAPRSVV